MIQLDKLDITDTLVAYATAIDRRDWELFRRCFTVDVVADYDTLGSWASLDDLTQFMVDLHAPFGPTMHRLSNFVIDVTGDTASARTYVDALITHEGTSGVNGHGYYDDSLVRTADGWRIARRRFTLVRGDRLR